MSYNILDEITYNIKHEKLVTKVKGSAVIIAAIGIIAVILTVCHSWYKNKKYEKACAESVTLSSLLHDMLSQNQSEDEILHRITAMRKGNSIYSALAGFYVNPNTKSGSLNHNITSLKQVSKNKYFDYIIREYAHLMSIQQQLRYRYDDGILLMQDFKNTHNNHVFPYFALLLETAIVINSNKFAEAKALCKKILLDTNTSEVVRNIVHNIQHYIYHLEHTDDSAK